MSNEIVDVKGATREKEIQNAKTSDGTNDAIQLKKRQLISLFLLVEDACGKINGFDVRT